MNSQLYQHRLGDLLPGVELGKYAMRMVSGLSDDTRTLKKGNLFLAYKGCSTNGQLFITDAIKQGAVAIIKQAEETAQNQPVSNESNVPVITISDLKKYRVKLAKTFYHQPQDQMSIHAITGTNGKTSCSLILAELFSMLEGSAAVIGTLGVQGYWYDNNKELRVESLIDDSKNTTPGLLDVYKYLALIRDHGIKCVFIEATSIGLDQKRLEGLRFKTGILTNLSHDHLDYHIDYDAYQRAKYRLFEEYEVTKAVLPIDDPVGRKWLNQLSGQMNCITYSIYNSDADLYCSNLSYSLDGIDAQLAIKWADNIETSNIKTRLIGEFNLLNILACISLVLINGYLIQHIKNYLETLKPVKGRLEPIANDKGLYIFIDYAHTPDALEKVLSALVVLRRDESKLWCVFGCGGNRDQAKRPMMGEIAAKMSDHVVITSDNPRQELPDQIISHIYQGTKKTNNQHIHQQSDRRLAIAYALNQAKKGDIVLIAGKGHETYQEINGVRHLFSDQTVITQLLDRCQT